MSKLLTPTQYEDILGELNNVRPLDLSDEVKLSLDIPLFNLNTPDTDKPVVGKLVRCDNYGALLKENSENYRNVEVKEVFIVTVDTLSSVTFSQVVHGVEWEFSDEFRMDTIFWVDPNTGNPYQQLSMTGTTWINFVGKRFYLMSTGHPAAWIFGRMHGFYN